VLGLGFVTGAIGVPITGAIADAFGMQTAMRLQVIVVVVAIVVARFLPSEARLRALKAEQLRSAQLLEARAETLVPEHHATADARPPAG